MVVEAIVEIPKGSWNKYEFEHEKGYIRAVVPFTISCGRCFYCKKGLWSLCDNSNPNAWIAEGAYGYSGAGLYGYSHMYGTYHER